MSEITDLDLGDLPKDLNLDSLPTIQKTDSLSELESLASSLDAVQNKSNSSQTPPPNDPNSAQLSNLIKQLDELDFPSESSDSSSSASSSSASSSVVGSECSYSSSNTSLSASRSASASASLSLPSSLPAPPTPALKKSRRHSNLNALEKLEISLSEPSKVQKGASDVGTLDELDKIISSNDKKPDADIDLSSLDDLKSLDDVVDGKGLDLPDLSTLDELGDLDNPPVKKSETDMDLKALDDMNAKKSLKTPDLSTLDELDGLYMSDDSAPKASNDIPDLSVLDELKDFGDSSDKKKKKEDVVDLSELDELNTSGKSEKEPPKFDLSVLDDLNLPSEDDSERPSHNKNSKDSFSDLVGLLDSKGIDTPQSPVDISVLDDLALLEPKSKGMSDSPGIDGLQLPEDENPGSIELGYGKLPSVDDFDGTESGAISPAKVQELELLKQTLASREHSFRKSRKSGKPKKKNQFDLEHLPSFDDMVSDRPKNLKMRTQSGIELDMLERVMAENEKKQKSQKKSQLRNESLDFGTLPSLSDLDDMGDKSESCGSSGSSDSLSDELKMLDTALPAQKSEKDKSVSSKDELESLASLLDKAEMLEGSKTSTSSSRSSSSSSSSTSSYSSSSSYSSTSADCSYSNTTSSYDSRSMTSSFVPSIPSSAMSSQTSSFSSVSSATGTSCSSTNSFASSSSSTTTRTLSYLHGLNDLVAEQSLKDKNTVSVPSPLASSVTNVHAPPPCFSLDELFIPPNSEKPSKPNKEVLELEKLLASVPATEKTKELVREIGFSADMNRNGLRRGKKRRVVCKNGDNVYTMEDTEIHLYPFHSDSNLAYIGVFDGFSGEACAKEATTAVPDAIASEVSELGGRDKLNDSDGFWDRVYAKADQALKVHQDVGCTATSVLVWESNGKRYLQCANCGDSSAYLYTHGTVHTLTTEHKVTAAAEKARARAMNPDLPETATRINGVAVARALGVHFIKKMNLGIISVPSVSTVVEVPFEDEALLVVASDGLWDVMSGEEAGNLVLGLASAQEMSDKLLKAALKSIKCVDNVTVVVAKL